VRAFLQGRTEGNHEAHHEAHHEGHGEAHHEGHHEAHHEARPDSSSPGGSALADAARGIVSGLGLPSYAGRAVPHLRRLLGEGAPVAGAASFVITALSLDLAGAALVIPLFGVPFAALRLASGLAITIVVSLIVSRIAARPAPHAAAP